MCGDTIIPDVADVPLRHVPLATEQMDCLMVTSSSLRTDFTGSHLLRHETLLNNSTFRLTFGLSKSLQREGERGGGKEGGGGGGQVEDTTDNR